MGLPRRCFEFTIQVAAMIATAGAVVAAVYVFITYRGLTEVHRNLIGTESENLLDQTNLFLRTEATVGLVFATAGIVTLVGFVALVGRVCNQESGSSKRVFTCLYLLFILLCFCGFAAAGVLGVFTTMDWSDIEGGLVNQLINGSNTILSLFLKLFGISISFPVLEEAANAVEIIWISLAAASACSLFAALLFLILEATVLICSAAAEDY